MGSGKINPKHANNKIKYPKINLSREIKNKDKYL